MNEIGLNPALVKIHLFITPAFFVLDPAGFGPIPSKIKKKLIHKLVQKSKSLLCQF